MSLNMQMLEPVQLVGVTAQQLQEIYSKSIKKHRSRIFYIDAAYMYTFDDDNFKHVKQFNLLGRSYAQEYRKLDLLKRIDPRLVNQKHYDLIKNYNSGYCRYWHASLEQWFDGKQVELGGHLVKPVKIVRSLDLVVNEGMEMIAGCLTGHGDAIFDVRGIGDGDIDEPDLSDEDLISRKDLINVNETPEGGSLSVEGTTIISVGNHSKELQTPANSEYTECGMFDDLNTSRMHMLEHSAFDDPIPHTQSVNSPGSTSIIYQCSG